MVYDEKGKFHTAIAIPPKEIGIDIIPFGETPKHYYYDFDGLVIISKKLYREVLHKGKRVAFKSRKNIWKQSK